MSNYDVVIIGGGIIGTSIAFELAGEKLRVLVLERQQPGQEASWAAAGMLSPAPDSPRDIPLVPLSAESLKLYPQFVSAVEEASGKSTAYAREGALEIFFGPQAAAQRDRLIEEHHQLALAADPVSSDVIREWEKSISADARAAAWLPEEGSVEPRALMNAVLAAARNRRVEIRAERGAESVLCERGRCTGVIAGGDRISAAHVVLAAGSFSAQIAASDSPNLRVPTRPVRGQMLSLRPNGSGLRRVVRSRNGYLVPRRDGRIVAGSTIEQAGFEKRVTPAGIRKILDAVLEMCPDFAGAALLDTWCGLRPGTPDDLPILGPSEIEGLLVATGHYRNGILLAPVTASLIRDWIVRGQPEFDATAFSPLRFAAHQQKARKAV